MTHDHYRELLALHAVGSLEEGEERMLEAHLQSCRFCARELAALREAAANLALLVSPAAPPPDSLRRLFAALDAAETRPDGRGLAPMTRRCGTPDGRARPR
jgi:anti-sigma factor RsiW